MAGKVAEAEGRAQAGTGKRGEGGVREGRRGAESSYRAEVPGGEEAGPDQVEGARLGSREERGHRRSRGV